MRVNFIYSFRLCSGKCGKVQRVQILMQASGYQDIQRLIGVSQFPTLSLKRADVDLFTNDTSPLSSTGLDLD